MTLDIFQKAICTRSVCVKARLDAIPTFDAIHEQAQPLDILEGVRYALKAGQLPGVTVVAVDVVIHA